MSRIAEWSLLVERACQLVGTGRGAARLANLSVAAQIAARRGHWGTRRRLDGSGLADAVGVLAIDPLDLDVNDVLTWGALADDAAQAALVFAQQGGMDLWVEAFQATDPARKSRGAYATPQALARPLARLLLRGRPVPARIIDPSAGAGGLLVAVLRELAAREPAAPLEEHVRRLHGVELDPVARELCCLLIWLAARQAIPIAEIASRITVANAITRNWWAADEPYEALVMNPPWDSLRDAAAGTDAERLATLARLKRRERGAPELPDLYSAQGRGDRNLYKAFVELAPHLLARGGRLVALIPGGWSSDLGTACLRHAYLKHLSIEQWTSFENRRRLFPIDARYKFGVLAGCRDSGGTSTLRTRAFAVAPTDLRRAHFAISASDISSIGGPASIVPDVTSASETRLMARYARRGVRFFDGSGPFGDVLYEREVDLTEDRKQGLFNRLENVDARPLGDGRWRTADGRELVPLVEGRMVTHYDFFAKSWLRGSGRTAAWTYTNGDRLRDCRPQFLIEPACPASHRLAICDVTSATNTRTVLATWVPVSWRCGNTAPVLAFATERAALAALAVLNSMVFDWLARRLVAGLHLNRFYLDALRWPALSEEQVDVLASAAAALQGMNSRYRELSGPRIATKAASLDLVDLHALIEHTVSTAYGLTAKDLRLVYSDDVRDRRGFWRYFASDPHAGSVVAKVLDAAGRRAVSPCVSRR